jgi:hypothetical protein
MESVIYLIPFTIEDLGLSCGIANFLKKGGLAYICSPHNENSKASELRSNILSRWWHVV